MNTSRVWMLGGVVLSIAILVGAYFIGVAPALASAEAADLGVVSVEAQNQAQRAELTRLETLAASQDDIADQLAELQKAIPASHLMSDYDARIEALANPLVVQILSIDYSEEVVPGATADTAAATTAPAGLVAVPVKVAVSGNLGQLMSFIKAAQLGDRYLSISSVTMTMDESTIGTTNLASLTINGFTFVLPQETAAPEGEPTVDPATGAASG
jgi:Tfp pilus assembly protein PilO